MSATQWRVVGVIGLLFVLACTGSNSEPTPTSTTSAVATSSSVSTTNASTTSVPLSVSPRPDWYLVWTSARLPPGFGSALRQVPGMEVVSVVWAGNAEVTVITDADGMVVRRSPPAMWFPLELQLIDPAAHALFAPESVAAALTSLQEDEVLLSQSSAQLHGIGPGAAAELSDGTVLTVTGVVPDRWVGAAELATTTQGSVAYGAELPRYAIVKFPAGRPALEEALAEITEDPVRVRSEGEIPVFRHADAVRAQVDIKQKFGEFPLRPGEGRSIEIESSWVDENIVTTDLPLLGTVSCHREFAGLLGQVMQDLETSGHGHLIDPDAFLGCWNPRFITGRRDLSRHAWGAAADINFGNAGSGPGSPTSPELVAAMKRAGITSGKDWLNPDPGHFEWYGTDS